MTQDRHSDVDVPGHAGAVVHHQTGDHGDDHGHDDHAHAEEPLGPIDVPAWSAAIVGVMFGLAVTLAFVLATSPVGPV